MKVLVLFFCIVVQFQCAISMSAEIFGESKSAFSEELPDNEKVIKLVKENNFERVKACVEKIANANRASGCLEFSAYYFLNQLDRFYNTPLVYTIRNYRSKVCRIDPSKIKNFEKLASGMFTKISDPVLDGYFEDDKEKLNRLKIASYLISKGACAYMKDGNRLLHNLVFYADAPMIELYVEKLLNNHKHALFVVATWRNKALITPQEILDLIWWPPFSLKREENERYYSVREQITDLISPPRRLAKL